MKTLKHYEVFIDPPSMGRPFCGRWIEVKANNRKEAKSEASLIAGVNIIYAKQVRELKQP